MKIFHLSDLHLGKRVYEYSMLEDQKYILREILSEIDEEHPEAVIIAGDIYDKSVPSAEAVEVFDDFLVRLAKRNLQVFVISGNHDSPERLAFGSRLIDASGIHLSPVYNGVVEPITLSDKYGCVNFFMLPFIKPAGIRRFFEDREISSYTDAVKAAVGSMAKNDCERNILIAHQFVTGAERSDSEDNIVGGLDNADVSAFEGFDYVALGHIHAPQNISKNIRYCGTPLKYSFSEVNQKKSITVIELEEKGNVRTRQIPLTPKHDMVEIIGTYEEVTAKSFYSGTTYQDDYVRVILKDEEDVVDAMTKLRVIYRNLMTLSYDNTRTRHSSEIIGVDDTGNKSTLELFSELFYQQNGKDLTDEERSFMSKIIEEVEEGEK